jgi:hypothetical protein
MSLWSKLFGNVSKNDLQPLLSCGKCGRLFVPGKTGQVMTAKVAATMMKMAVGVPEHAVPLDTVYPANETEWNATMTRTNNESLVEIRQGLASGQTRRWKCRACGHEQDYTKSP